uniref:Cadherin-related family member 4 isoform X1 n=1 Tax=Pogona vitticeps TaxID=103695 RepID=A0A6J0TD27_9SAUR
MGLGWPLSLLLLFTIYATDPAIGQIDLDGIPGTVWLEDSAPPGTTVANFTVKCENSSHTPSIIQKNIIPTTSFFNLPNTLSIGTYQVSLSSSAALDAREVNQYALTYSVRCADKSREVQLFVKVTAADKLECSSRSADIGRMPIQVPEDATPGLYIYKPVLKRESTGPLKFTLENDSVPFQMTENGIVQVPAKGFSREQAGKIFSMDIVVSDGSGASCRMPISVEIVSVYHNQVNFTETSVATSVLENTGPLQEIIQIHATGENVRYQIVSPDTSYFTIVPETGMIKNTYNLDLERNPGLAHTQLLVRAYNMHHPSDSADMTVNITVKPQNLLGPRCSPAVFVTAIPETTPTGEVLLPLSCVSAVGDNSSLHYQIEDGQSPIYSFRMDGPVLKVNTTLDTEVMGSLYFQCKAAILVTDSGSPPRTTRVPVLVTVTPVNEYFPQCLQRSFSVPENAGFGDLFGNASGVDQDYPFNNIEYNILETEAGPPTLFYIGRHTGLLYVLGPLDYELKKSYRLTISLKDLDNDANPGKQTTCNITINVQDVNDNAPVCEPPFVDFSILSIQARTTSITQLHCTDKDERSELSYSIVRGNTNGRFRMEGDRLFPNTFSYNRDGIFDPLIFELLIQVTDGRFSTTATVIVYVTPWTTTVPTTATTTTTVPKEPIVLHRTVEFWAPDPWFVVVLTLTGILLLTALGLLLWRLFWWKAQGEMSQPLLQDQEKGLGKNYIMAEEPSKEKDKGSTEMLSLHHQFDGRAQDPVTGQDYLFDSSSGARRWV